jgi:hypothetical protein
VDFAECVDGVALAGRVDGVDCVDWLQTLMMIPRL